jgi:hypothetical protein
MKTRKKQFILLILLTSIYVSLCYTQADVIRDETRVVYAGTYNGWMHTPTTSQILYIQYEVLEAGFNVTLQVFDSQNYISWRDGNSSVNELYVYDKNSAEVYCELEGSVTYYIILENPYLIQDIHVKITIRDDEFPLPITTPGNNRGFLIPLITAISVLSTFLLGLTGVAIRNKRSDPSKKKSGKLLQPLQFEKYEAHIVETRSGIDRYKICPNCNNTGYINENYCSFCGQKY